MKKSKPSGRTEIKKIPPERLVKFRGFNFNKNPTDATVCRYLFTAKLLYMFRVSQRPSSGALPSNVACSGHVGGK